MKLITLALSTLFALTAAAPLAERWTEIYSAMTTGSSSLTSTVDDSSDTIHYLPNDDAWGHAFDSSFYNHTLSYTTEDDAAAFLDIPRGYQEVAIWASPRDDRGLFDVYLDGAWATRGQERKDDETQNRKPQKIVIVQLDPKTDHRLAIKYVKGQYGLPSGAPRYVAIDLFSLKTA